MTGELKRYYLRHKELKTTYAVEGDDRGEILGVLDVSAEAGQGGICPHMLPSLPLAGRIDEVEYLMKHRDEFAIEEPDCRNAHHLMTDLLLLESDYRAMTRQFEQADAEAKALKKRMEAQGDKVHSLLCRIQDRKPLPLFETAAA
jgi:hypothetical protein